MFLWRSLAGHSKSVERKASLRKVDKVGVAPIPSPATSRAIVTSRDRKIHQMLELAEELGYSCTPHTTYLKDLATSIAARLKNRSGTSIYQTVTWSAENFPLDLAHQAFAMASRRPSTSPRTTTWCCENMPQVDAVFGSLFEEHHMCFGASKALQAPSEPVIRVLATIVPGVEISHVELARGVYRLYISLMFVLIDEDGEMHMPKDDQRIELAMENNLINELRAQAAKDAACLAELGAQLSAGWWRQLGNVHAAQMAEAMVLNFNSNPTPAKGKRRCAADVYEVARIVEMRGKWALVEWAGHALRGRTPLPGAPHTPRPPPLPPPPPPLVHLVPTLESSVLGTAHTMTVLVRTVCNRTNPNANPNPNPNPNPIPNLNTPLSA